MPDDNSTRLTLISTDGQTLTFETLGAETVATIGSRRVQIARFPPEGAFAGFRDAFSPQIEFVDGGGQMWSIKTSQRDKERFQRWQSWRAFKEKLPCELRTCFETEEARSEEHTSELQSPQYL